MAAYQELKEQIQEKEAQQQTFQQLEETIRETEQQRVTLQQQLKRNATGLVTGCGTATSLSLVRRMAVAT